MEHAPYVSIGGGLAGTAAADAIRRRDKTGRLLDVLNQLVDGGATVVLVEHHVELLAACDWLIELGPDGGRKGGRLVAQGTPAEVSRGDSPSAPFLREALR